MCVLAIAWRAHPRWQLIAAANRDELHARPTQALARWPEPDHLLAGRDLQSGGTWLGVSEQGRFAAVTNVRGYGAAQPGRPSRGAVVTDFLTSTGTDGRLDEAQLAQCNPFNLIAADRTRIQFVSNRPQPVRRMLDGGIYGLSNGMLDEPWPKTVRLKSKLAEWIAGAADKPEQLLDVLADESRGDGQAAALEGQQDSQLSAIFIRDGVYGTRCSTVVAVDRHGTGVIIERRYSADAVAVGETELSFSWSGDLGGSR